RSSGTDLVLRPAPVPRLAACQPPPCAVRALHRHRRGERGTEADTRLRLRTARGALVRPLLLPLRMQTADVYPPRVSAARPRSGALPGPRAQPPAALGRGDRSRRTHVPTRQPLRLRALVRGLPLAAGTLG